MFLVVTQVTELGSNPSSWYHTASYASHIDKCPPFRGAVPLYRLLCQEWKEHFGLQGCQSRARCVPARVCSIFSSHDGNIQKCSTSLVIAGILDPSLFRKDQHYKWIVIVYLLCTPFLTQVCRCDHKDLRAVCSEYDAYKVLPLKCLYYTWRWTWITASPRKKRFLLSECRL